MNNYKDWIGKKISRSDIITPRLVDHLKKTIDQNCLSDQTVPEGIFLCLCPDVASINDLDKDGNTKLGIFLPELPYKISCLLYTSPSPRDRTRSRMPSSA